MGKLLFPSVLGDAPSNVAAMSLINSRKKQVRSQEKIEPTPFQQKIIDCPIDLILPGGRGGGKEMPISEPILTPSGWRTMGDIQVGNFVIGSEGQSCEVLEIHPQGSKDVYAVRFKDGTEVRCGLEHLWQVKDLKNKYRVYSVRQLLKMGITRLHSDSRTGLRHKFSVDAFTGREMGYVEAPYAYSLGYLLGNAHFQQPTLQVTCHSKYSDRLVELLTPSLGLPGTVRSYSGNCTQIAYAWAKIDPEVAKYRGSGLSGYKSLISTDNYLLWDFDSRLALLQGLMDSDGTQGSCPSGDRQRLSFFSTSKALIEVFSDLVRSIGGRCCNPRLDSREYESGYGAEVNFRTPVNPFRLRADEWTQPIYSMGCAIIEIENLGYQEESKCITINSPDSLYVTTGWKLTHNSVGVALAIANLVKASGEDYQGLYIRRSYKGITDFEKICRKVFRSTHSKATYNKTEKLWTFPNGATLELGQLEHESDYDKYQGRSFTQIIIDEATQYNSPELLDRLLSNIRGPIGVATSRVIVANPGNAGHGWVFERYIQNRTDNEQYFEPDTERNCVTINSTYRDNPTIDQEAYVSLLRSATATDLELRKAYVDGDWNIARGAFFSAVLSKDRSTIPALYCIPAGWKSLIGMDYGTAAPCSIYLAAISPGGSIDGKYFPSNSIVLIDELYLAEENNISKGLNLDIASAATRIKDFCTHWRHDPRSIYNIADDACFMKDGRDSIADLFKEQGVSFSRARKGDRASSLEHFKTMLLNAGTEKPGIYTTELCKYFWRTMPSLPRCSKNPSDLDTKSNDHIADCVRYISLSVRGSNEGLNMSKIGRC